ncbi:uncharacterized protein LOC114481240 isoform X9 [Gouania willdenowi]|uniref:uncharacterized protein LOC114481240 isoform X9 n=1 Tax=Gouania willdenowi TaxID=441366 RepID=UPI00105570AB|nr:uncharacterized protein LOC114481240 isoform X9 [Gouania willdenowi]
MAVPPSSTNVFQMLKDVFNKANGYEILNTDVKTKTLEGAEFKTSGSSNMDTNRVTGTQENKYKLPQQVHPSFVNVDKLVKDIINMRNGNGIPNTDVKTKTSEGAEFKTFGSSNMDTNRVTGTQENKYELPQQVHPSSTNVDQIVKDIINKAKGYGMLDLDVKPITLEGAEFKTSDSSNMDTNRVTGTQENKYELPQQVPPSFENVDQLVKDIFSKGYGYGMLDLDVKPINLEGAEFKTSGSSNMDTNRVTGTQENKYKLPQQVTMAVPPSFADLGKSAKDIFNKGYGYGMMNLDVKTKTLEGAEFKTSDSSNMDTNRVTGTQENKNEFPQQVHPSFVNVDKLVKDIFNMRNGNGIPNTDVKTKTSEGAEFKTSDSSNMDTNRVTGTQENKYKLPQQVPPSFVNVDKLVKDIINMRNGNGIPNTDVKTKTSEGAEFKTFGSSNMDTNRVTGFLENKYEFPQQVNMAVHPSCTNFFPMMKDICNKAKGNGMMNTDVKTKTSEGAEFKTSGSSNMDTNRVTGTQENKYELPQQVTMAVPPSFADLGKSAKDIFNKGYGYGMMNLDVKTKSSEGAEFKTSGSMNMDTNRVTGTQENQYKWPQHGLTFTEKWTTENTFGAGVCVEDKIAKGLKLSFDTMFSPNTGKTSNLLKTAYKREYLNAGLDVDLDFAGPTLHGAAVGGYKGWLGGCQMTYDSAKSKMTQGNISLGYKTEYTQIHTNIEDGKGFFGSIYQKVNDKLETAMNMGWRHDSNTTSFGIAAKYQLDSSAFISAKVNNSGLLGLGYTQSLRPGIKLTLSALLDGKNINAGGHKLGLGLEMET